MEQKEKQTSLWNLYFAFARIGLFTFGGGYAMLPMLERECVDHYGWTTRDELLNYFAIGQCTPGVIAVNTATFIGANERGVLGALATTLGVVTPSLIIISIIAALLNNFAHIEIVQHAFAGIRVAIGVLIINAVIKLLKQNKEGMKNILSIILCVGAFAVTTFFDISPVIVVVIAALVGLFFYGDKEGKK